MISMAIIQAPALRSAGRPSIPVRPCRSTATPTATPRCGISGADRGRKRGSSSWTPAASTYELAVPMREWSEELLAGDAARLGRERCARLGRLTDVDPRAIWERGFVERASTGLLATRVGADRMGRGMLDVAKAWAAS